jgi:uncharacterized membrane protein
MASLREGDYLLMLAILSVAGTILAGYLTYTHYYPPEHDFCDINNFLSCSGVRESPYAGILGVPVAVIGLAGFVAILVLTLLRFFKYDWPMTEQFPLLILLLSAAGTGFGVYLTYLEFFVILAVCLLCLASFFLITISLVVAYRLYRMA